MKRKLSAVAAAGLTRLPDRSGHSGTSIATVFPDHVTTGGATMKKVMPRVTSLIAGAILAGGTVLAGVSPASADQGAMHASATADSSRSAVACYLYVWDRFGYYNVRTSKSPTASLIVKYTGTRLPVWDRCGEEVGQNYRCTSSDPVDNSWVAVNYKGRKGYVAAYCAGGLGT
ncbi:hypothetical protein [Micromonospora sp. NPDC005172]|uniref:hypothetical protein n=1 Tax=Micromonospora sp. NPDC005172 TaxID=3156867 RepID=UPI0033A86E0B